MHVCSVCGLGCRLSTVVQKQLKEYQFRNQVDEKAVGAEVLLPWRTKV